MRKTTSTAGDNDVPSSVDRWTTSHAYLTLDTKTCPLQVLAKLYEWTDQRTDERTDGQTYGRMDGQTLI